MDIVINKKLAHLLLVLLLILISAIYIQKAHTYKLKSIFHTSTLPSISALKPTPIPHILHIYSLKENTLFLLASIPTTITNEWIPKQTVANNKGEIFYVDGKTLMKYNLNSRKKETIYKVLDSHKEIGNIKIISDNLYWTDVIATKNDPSEQTHILKEYNTVTNKERTITSLVPGVWTGLHYLFKSTDGADIIGTLGGDGCGGWGKVYRKINKLDLIVETGGGCNEKPSHVGSIKNENKLVMLSTIPNTFPDLKYDKLYTYDVITNNKVDLFNLRNIPEIQRVLVDDNSNIGVIITKSQILLINLTSKTIEKRIIQDNSHRHSWILKDNKVIYLEDNQKNISIIDLQTIKTKVISWKDAELSSPPNFLTTWNELPLFTASY